MAGRTKAISKEEIRQRAATAREHLTIARMELEAALAHDGPSAESQVAAENAIAAAIAASDAICGAKLGVRSAEQDHRSAETLLASVIPDGPELAKRFSRVVSDKTKLAYGRWPTAANVSNIVKHSAYLVEALDRLV